MFLWQIVSAQNKSNTPATKTTVNKNTKPKKSIAKPTINKNTKPSPSKPKPPIQGSKQSTPAIKKPLPAKNTTTKSGASKAITQPTTPQNEVKKPIETVKEDSTAEKKELKDSTFYNVMHYKLPDSTKIFFNQMVHPKTRDSIYFQETDIVDLFIYTFSNKKAKVNLKPTKQKKIFWSFFPTGNPVARNAIVTATNAAFYLGSTKDTKLSNFNFLAFYNWFNQFTFPIRANVWTARNKYNLQGDYRFYYYPSPTFGLGPNTKAGDRDLITYNYIRFHQTVLRKINDHVFAGLGYAWDYHGAINDQNPESNGGKDFKDYREGTSGSSVSSGITFNALYDDRQNSINPQKGNYVNAVFRVNGRALASDNNWQSIYLDGRKYISFSSRKNQILCFWGLAWLTVSGNPPYLDLPSMGWDSYSTTARGYIQGRFTGKNMLYFETEYRFNLMRNGLLGAVVFSNVSAFPDHKTNLNMRLLPALGTGLRIKINRDSRTNFAFDFAHGIEDNWGFWLGIGEFF